MNMSRNSLPSEVRGIFFRKMKFCRIGAWLAFIAFICPVRAQQPEGGGAPRFSPDFGINLPEISPSQTTLYFADAIKSALGWGDPGDPRSRVGKIPVDERGWPKEDAGIVVHEGVKGIGGVYKLSFQGKADVKGFEGVEVKNLTRDESTGVTTADVVVPEDATTLMLSFTGTEEGVRDVKLMRPMEAEGIFTKEFLKMIEPYSLLRFTAMMGTDGSTWSEWNQRRLPEDAIWTGQVPLEVIIELCNLTGKDPWVSVPHNAGPELVRNMAKMLKAKLSDDRTVYAELSNELWNPALGQARDYAELARKLEPQRSKDPVLNYVRYLAERVILVMLIWEEEFEDQASRLVRVLAGHFANPWMTEQMIEWFDTDTYVDAYAVAPYFGESAGQIAEAKATLEGGLDGLFASLEKELSGRHRDLLLKSAEIAEDNSMYLIAYAGGQHLVASPAAPSREKLAEMFIQANRDPRMQDLYRKHLRLWNEASGGNVYALYDLCGAFTDKGCWGLQEWMGQPESETPKRRAVMEELKAAETKSAP